MGQEIVYCSRCQGRLSGADFEKGRAFRFHDLPVCAACARKMLSTLPPAERQKLQAVMTRPFKSGPLPIPPGAPPRPGSTAKMTTIPRPPSTRAGRPAEGSAEEAVVENLSARKKILLVSGAAGGVILVILFLLVLLPGKTRRYALEEPPKAPPTAGPAPAGLGPAPPAGGGGAEDLARARDFGNAHPDDFDGQIRAWEEAVSRTQGTPFHPEARRELEALRGRMKTVMDDAWAGLENDLRGPLEREEFQSAADLCERAASLFKAQAWVERAIARARGIRERPAALFPQVKEKAAEARERGDREEVARLRERVYRWGIGNFLLDFDAAVAGTAPPAAGPAPAPAPPLPPGPPPVPGPPAPPETTLKPALPPAVAAYRQRWEKAMRHAAARDFISAASDIVNASRALEDADLKREAAADLEAVNFLDAALGETLKALAARPVGEKVALNFRDETGRTRRFEGVLVRALPGRLILRNEDEATAVEVGEILGASLADLYLARPGARPDADRRTAALFCLLDGDAEAARRLVPGPGETLPEKYWDLARALAEEGAGASTDAARMESEARKIFRQAVRELALPKTTWAGVQKIHSLLEDFAGTTFVRRNRASMEGRKAAGREYYFLPSDLVASGSFKRGRSPRGMEALIAGADVEGAAAKDNYVEFEFSALPGLEYRCWVLVGGCCRDNFSFFQQATEMTMPDPRNPRQKVQVDPGGGYAQALKVSISGLKPSHAAHGGKKEPTRFEWVPVPLPPYASPGPKVVRLLAEVEGAAVARVLVSSVRKEVPRDAEVAELERARGEESALGLTLKPPSGKIFREWWTGVKDGLGGLRRRLNQKPSGSDFLTSFSAPRNWADEYGTRIRGYLHPPKKGKYVFWIASDNESELWLGDEEDPAGKRKIASVRDYTGPTEWEKHKEQKSDPIELEAGRRYYVEVLHVEGKGGDHVSVGWQLPDGTLERPIPGERLSEFK